MMRRRLWLCVLGVAILGVGTWWIVDRGAQYRPITPVYVGSSTGLRQTVIVPTLDSPLPADRNVIWCATLAMAWRQAQDRIFHAPIQLSGSQHVAQRLNNAPLSNINLDPKDYYANAGRIENGIIATIQHDMAAKFPAIPSSWLPSPPRTATGIDAYAYLATHVKFAIPYLELPAGTTFVDGSGRSTAIRAFGISQKYDGSLRDLRQQVDVLFFSDGYRGEDEFAVDLCRKSQPYRVILARIPPKTTLAETVAEVQRRISKNSRPMESSDTLTVPVICWRLTHHFTELEGHTIVNPGGASIDEVWQNINFTLDRSGVQLASAANIETRGISKRLEFTRPFLLYLTRRGSDAPFFAMWVNNAELLNK